MKSSKLAIFMAMAFAAVSCADKAHISVNVADAPNSKIIVKQLDVNVYSSLDTVKTDASGNFKYSVDVKEGQPEFIYLFHGDKRIAALLLEKGERVKVSTDTLGNYTLDNGSKGSTELAIVDKAYTTFAKNMLALMDKGDSQAMSREYVKHYRECVKYVIENPKSLTCVPVLYEELGVQVPIFSQNSDALFFKSTADSLMTVYPESKYVKALCKEADRRMRLLQLSNRLNDAESKSFPELEMPDMTGSKKALSSVDAKVIMVHFWDAADAAQKIFNLDKLMPLYNEYHKLGFEIYSVCLTPDKAAWGSIVTSQKLPWINVNDGLGTYSPSILTYNVTELPQSVLIVNGELSTKQISGENAFRKELDSILRR